MKILAILLLVIIIAFSLVLAYQKSNDVEVQKAKLEQEMYQKMLAEEKLDKAGKEIRSLQSSLTVAESKAANTKSLLDQTVKINKDLKERLDKAAVVRQKLEEKILAMERLSRKEEELAVVGPN